jgi:Helix-turn-helix domain
VAHESIVYDRRVRLIEYAARIGNVAEACRVFGVSRKTYYEWLGKAERYGLSALAPRDRRQPHQPNAMSSEEVAVILSEAIARPTLGPRSLLRHGSVAWSGPRPGWPRCCGGTTWARPGCVSPRSPR